MPEKDTGFWGAAATSLAAIGAMLRFYLDNKARAMGLSWWRDWTVDIVGSVSLALVMFLGATHFVGEIAAAGVGGLVGHLGARQTVLIIRSRFSKTGKSDKP